MAAKTVCELAYEGNLNDLRKCLGENTDIKSITDKVSYELYSGL